MRVTQSMLTHSSARHLSQSYQNLHTLQNQLSTGKKISRASQDPVVAMNGMRYRTQATEVSQFKRNLSEVYNWMDNADAVMDKTGSTPHRVRELAVQASNDTYEETQRKNMAQEIRQLREHLESLANTKVNNKFIFNGTNTKDAPLSADKINMGIEVLAEDPASHVITYNSEVYELDAEHEGEGLVFRKADSNETITITDLGGENQELIFNNGSGQTNEPLERQIVVSEKGAVSTNNEKVEIELMKGVNVPVNVNPGKVFSADFFGDIIQLEKALEDPATTSEELIGLIASFDRQIEKVVNERAELGARYNRVEMIDDRIQEQEVIAKRILSENEDVDIEKVITELLAAENVHRAALASTSRIMRPTLMDFLR